MVKQEVMKQIYLKMHSVVKKDVEELFQRMEEVEDDKSSATAES